MEQRWLGVPGVARYGPWALAALSSALLAGCGSDAATGHSVAAPPACDRTAVATAMSESGGALGRPHRNLSELLPNVRHAWRNSPAAGQSVTDSAVLGRVTSVVRDRGFVESGQGGTAGRPGAATTTYGDPAAHWRTVRLTVAVDEVLSGPALDELEVDVALMGNATTGEDDSQVECAFTDLGTVAVFSKANPDAPEFLGIGRQLPDEPFGIADVDASERLHLPFATAASGRSPQSFLGEVDTVERLRREAGRPGRTVLHDG